MLRRLTTALCALGLFSAVGAQAKDAASAKDCVGISKTQTGDGLVFNLRNACAHQLDCKITWKLTCGKKAPQLAERGRVNFAMPPDTTHSAEASAAMCGFKAWRERKIRPVLIFAGDHQRVGEVQSRRFDGDADLSLAEALGFDRLKRQRVRPAPFRAEHRPHTVPPVPILNRGRASRERF